MARRNAALTTAARFRDLQAAVTEGLSHAPAHAPALEEELSALLNTLPRAPSLARAFNLAAVYAGAEGGGVIGSEKTFRFQP